MLADIRISGPILWAISTHIDKYFVERYFQRNSIAVLLLFTALTGLLFLPGIGLCQRVAAPPLTDLLAIGGSGILYIPDSPDDPAFCGEIVQIMV